MELLVVFLELFLEFFLQIFLEGVADSILRAGNRGGEVDPNERKLLRFLFWCAMGLVLGLVSTNVVEGHVIRNLRVRGIALLILPAVCGALMHYVGKIFVAKGSSQSSLENFASGAGFSFCFGVMRYAFCN